MIGRIPWYVWTPLLLVGTAASAADDTSEIVKLRQHGLSDEVVLAYVRHSERTYDLDDQELDALEDAGVSPEVIDAMLERHPDAADDAPRQEPLADRQAAPRAPGEAGEPGDAQRYTYTDPGPVRTDGDVQVAAGLTVAPPGSEVNFSFFYGELAPHGQWRHLAPYGYVWTPTVAVGHADWRPYCDHGHWLHSDQGWYWYSDYSWGWIPFHYGRWHYDPGYHWVWVPDTVWAPAWVDWRVSDEYYGWAPLPPEARFEAGVGFSFHGDHVGFGFHFGLHEDRYAFVPSGSFFAADLRRVAVPRHRRRDVYNRTTVVNNTYIVGDNNQVINRGVSIDHVRRSTRGNIETVRIRNLEASSNEALAAGEVRQGGSVSVFRPRVRNSAPADPTQAATARQARIERAIRDGRVRQVEGAAARRARWEQAQATRAERREERQEQRQENRQRRQSQRETRREDAQERREERQEQRQENRQRRQSQRETRREDVQERREERQEQRQENRQRRQSQREARREDARKRQNQEQERRQQRLQDARVRQQQQRQEKTEPQEGALQRRQERKRRQRQRQAVRQQRRQERHEAVQQRRAERQAEQRRRQEARKQRRENRRALQP
ncbi:MAG: hypothetical protein M5U26_17230 [Planctomycetota bacterium]|nr:hypothetical protein [Planctomycetota bacterium]